AAAALVEQLDLQPRRVQGLGGGEPRQAGTDNRNGCVHDEPRFPEPLASRSDVTAGYRLDTGGRTLVVPVSRRHARALELGRRPWRRRARRSVMMQTRG